MGCHGRHRPICWLCSCGSWHIDSYARTYCDEGRPAPHRRQNFKSHRRMCWLWDMPIRNTSPSCPCIRKASRNCSVTGVFFKETAQFEGKSASYNRMGGAGAGGGVEAKFHLFQTSELNEDKRPASSSGRFAIGQESPVSVPLQAEWFQCRQKKSFSMPGVRPHSPACTPSLRWTF